MNIRALLKERGKMKTAVVLGSSGAGKTALMRRCVDGEFIGSNEVPTTGVHIHQGESMLQIWDISGQERFQALAMTYVIKAAVVIFVYDISRRASLLELQDVWLPAVINAFSPTHQLTMPVLHLVGCKMDLAEHSREVTQDEAIALAGKFDMAHYGECSAKTGDGIARLVSLLSYETSQIPVILQEMIETAAPQLNPKVKSRRSLFTCCPDRCTRRKYVELEPK